MVDHDIVPVSFHRDEGRTPRVRLVVLITRHRDVEHGRHRLEVVRSDESGHRDGDIIETDLRRGAAEQVAGVGSKPVGNPPHIGVVSVRRRTYGVTKLRCTQARVGVERKRGDAGHDGGRL